MMNEINYEIKPVGGHFELYIDGMFYASADTYEEAITELEQYEKELPYA